MSEVLTGGKRGKFGLVRIYPACLGGCLSADYIILVIHGVVANEGLSPFRSTARLSTNSVAIRSRGRG
jgi:hypothetical protein